MGRCGRHMSAVGGYVSDATILLRRPWSGAPSRTRAGTVARSMAPPTAGIASGAGVPVREIARHRHRNAPSTQRSMWPPRIMANESRGEVRAASQRAPAAARVDQVHVLVTRRVPVPCPGCRSPSGHDRGRAAGGSRRASATRCRGSRTRLGNVARDVRRHLVAGVALHGVRPHAARASAAGFRGAHTRHINTWRYDSLGIERAGAARSAHLDDRARAAAAMIGPVARGLPVARLPQRSGGARISVVGAQRSSSTRTRPPHASPARRARFRPLA